MQRRRLTQKDKDKIFELYKENYTYYEIEEELEIEVHTIYWYLNYSRPKIKPVMLPQPILPPTPPPPPEPPKIIIKARFCPYCDRELTSEMDRLKGYHYEQYGCICKHRQVKVSPFPKYLGKAGIDAKREEELGN